MKVEDVDVPLVSIICNTFNHEQYVVMALKGLVMQRVKGKVELLLHDDASTDNTVAIIKSFEAKMPSNFEFRPIYQQENQYSKGVKIGINYQYSRVRGKYIAICEGDDYWTDPLKLQKQIDFLEEHPDYWLTHTDVDMFFQKTSVLLQGWNKTKNKLIPDGEVYEALLVDNFIKTCTVVFRSAAMSDGKFADLMRKHLWAMGDKPLWLYISVQGKIKYLPESTTVYRINEESASQSNDYRKKFQFTRKSYEVSRYFMDHYTVSKATEYELEALYSKRQFLHALIIPDKEEAAVFFKRLMEWSGSMKWKEKIKYNILYMISKNKLLSGVFKRLLVQLKVGKISA